MNRSSMGCSGFTLHELLVVTALMTFLMAILLPLLEQVRATARDVNCKANLRTLQQGWGIHMSQSSGVIPYTRSTYRHPNWWDTMDAVYASAPDVWGDNAGTFNACPTVQRRYPDIFYRTTRWGYAVNVWWADGATGEDGQLNELRPWAGIRNPSRYPWFMDPDVAPWGSSYIAASYAPNTLTRWGAPRWGVGAHHGDERTTNTSYADGSVRSVEHSKITAQIIESDDKFTWFANR